MEKTALIVMILTIFSKILGFFREIILSYFYGTSGISDAYLISTTIPEVMFNVVGIGIATTYIPMYNKIVEEKDLNSAENFTSNVVNVNMLICSVLFLFGISYTKPIVKLFASGFEDEILKMAVKFTKIALVGIYFSGLTSIYIGYLQIKNNFWAPALIGVP